jgi:hypothetical protein
MGSPTIHRPCHNQAFFYPPPDKGCVTATKKSQSGRGHQTGEEAEGCYFGIKCFFLSLHLAMQRFLPPHSASFFFATALAGRMASRRAPGTRPAGRPAAGGPEQGGVGAGQHGVPGIPLLHGGDGVTLDAWPGRSLTENKNPVPVCYPPQKKTATSPGAKGRK